MSVPTLHIKANLRAFPKPQQHALNCYLSQLLRNMLWAVVLSLLVSQTLAEAPEDEVKSLPGLTVTPTFKHYAGYLDATPGRHFFYWLTEAQNVDPATAPTVFWFNGGPGCSSVNGMWTENGPFYLSSDGSSVLYREFPWNSRANVIFLESPAGVGYAYADNQSLIRTDDEEVAFDNYAAIGSFYQKFPEYLPNPLFLTGESYAGIYIPTLSYLLVNQSNNYNFQGFAVGNGLHEYRSNFNTEVLFDAFHGLFDVSTTEKLFDYCCVGTPLRCDFYDTRDPTCIAVVNDAMVAANLAGVNPYGIYDYCARGAQGTSLLPKFRPLPKAFTNEQRKKIENLRSDPPCNNGDVTRSYFNNPDVRAALHVPATVQQWDTCSDPVSLVYGSTYETMTPQYQFVLGHVRALVYAGDTDSVCNFLGGEYFVENLGRELIQDYHPWLFQNQTAGFVKLYNNITYLTVLGAGHMVPTDRPPQALDMLNRFIYNIPYL